MSKPIKYTIWIKCSRDDAGYEIPRDERTWEVSETGCTLKTAERIVREIRHDFGSVLVRLLPDGTEAPI